MTPLTFMLKILRVRALPASLVDGPAAVVTEPFSKVEVDRPAVVLEELATPVVGRAFFGGSLDLTSFSSESDEAVVEPVEACLARLAMARRHSSRQGDFITCKLELVQSQGAKAENSKCSAVGITAEHFML